MDAIERIAAIVEEKAVQPIFGTTQSLGKQVAQQGLFFNKDGQCFTVGVVSGLGHERTVQSYTDRVKMTYHLIESNHIAKSETIKQRIMSWIPFASKDSDMLVETGKKVASDLASGAADVLGEIFHSDVE